MSDRCPYLVNVVPDPRFPMFYRCGKRAEHLGNCVARSEEQRHDEATARAFFGRFGDGPRITH